MHDTSHSWQSNTHFCRIRDVGGAGRPPPPIIIVGRTYPNKLYIIRKGIYRRVWFILDIDKIFWFRDFMSNFCEMLRKGSRKNFKLLKYEHIIHNYTSFQRTWSGDSVDINCFAKYLNFAEIWAKTDFAKFLKAFIKSRNLDISQKSLHMRDLQITCFKAIYKSYFKSDKSM